jgi:hypothetical protein
MKSDRWLVGLLAAIALLGIGWWWQATEWHEETVRLPMHGEAARDPWYSVQRLAQGLGVRVQRPDGFDTLPPTDATLLNTSRHWSLLPGRARALRQWVEGGGHLVLEWTMLARLRDPDTDHDDEEEGKLDASLHWVPVRQAIDAADGEAVDALRAKRPRTETTALCRPYAEPAGQPGAYGTPRRYQVCNHAAVYLHVIGQHLWSVDGPAGPYAVTVPVGRGRVSVLADSDPLGNRSLLDGDHALLLAAALQLRPGRELWLLTEEKRPPLPLWLWQHAAVPLVLAGVALALALWRAGLRFGPLAAPPPATRRAVTEQVQGTAAFLARSGDGALRQAQQRALDEAAAQRLPGWAGLADEAGRCALIARHTGLDTAALAASRGPGSGRRALAPDLQLLEIARRRLLAGAAPPPVTRTASTKAPHAHRR